MVWQSQHIDNDDQNQSSICWQHAEMLRKGSVLLRNWQVSTGACETTFFCLPLLAVAAIPPDPHNPATSEVRRRKVGKR